MSTASNVFLSYSAPDRPSLIRLGQALRDRGLKPFIDHWALVKGQAW
jgi:hypothetical protein